MGKLTVKRLGPGYVFLNDGTSWPRPGGDEGWHARYGTPVPLTLAEFVSAYHALIWLPEKRRNEVIRCLRVATHERDENGDIKPASTAGERKGGERRG